MRHFHPIVLQVTMECETADSCNITVVIRWRFFRQLGVSAMHLLRAILGVTTFRYAECEGFNDAVQGRSVFPHVSRCGPRYLHDSMLLRQRHGSINRVTWKYGKEGLEWKTVIRNPRGQGEYQLVLSPLWAVEGGVIAVEIVIAPGAAECESAGREGKWPRIPLRDNCRGTSKGVAKSKFGALRNFQVQNIVLRVNIESFRRGRGLGSGSGFCRECKNIQELSMRISVES